jgi:hypothetical protein
VLATDESRDVGALKHAGIQAMAKQYKLQLTYAPKNSDTTGGQSLGLCAPTGHVTAVPISGEDFE